MSDIDVGLSNFILKLADDTKLGKSLITDHDRVSLEDDMRNISEWFQRREMSFNDNKCQILQVGKETKNLNTR